MDILELEDVLSLCLLGNRREDTTTVEQLDNSLMSSTHSQ